MDKYELLERFLDVAAGEGYVFDNVDAADLYKLFFPIEYERKSNWRDVLSGKK